MPSKKTEKEEAPDFLDYVGLIWKTARSFQRSTGVDAEELMSVGRSSFVGAALAWDKDRGHFPPLLQKVLRNVFSHYTKRYPPVTEAGGTIRDRLFSNHPEWHPYKALISKEKISVLSGDARYVVWLLMNVPCEAFGITGATQPKMIRGAIRRELRREGWAWKRIWKTNNELKEAARGH